MLPNQVTTPLLTESTVVYMCLLVGVIGLLVLGGIVWFGMYLYGGRFLRRFPFGPDDWFHFVERWLHGPGNPSIRPLVETYTEQLQRRNEFCTSYGQTIVAVLMIVVLTILLLTRTISAEAGLPILSGISGFAIAKSVSASRTGPASDPGQRG